jgi:hypothetical protein
MGLVNENASLHDLTPSSGLNRLLHSAKRLLNLQFAICNLKYFFPGFLIIKLLHSAKKLRYFILGDYQRLLSILPHHDTLAIRIFFWRQEQFSPWIPCPIIAGSDPGFFASA